MTSDAAGEPFSGPRELERLQLPERALFWHWVWAAVRPVLGWLLVAAGALALFLGWYGVSGQALTAKQLPYLVSGGLSGIGLIVVAGVFLATDDVRRQLQRLDAFERKIDDLYGLFIESGATPGEAEPTEFVALPGGASFHRADCTLVAGKPSARRLTSAAASERGLRPCRLCEPSFR